MTETSLNPSQRRTPEGSGSAEPGGQAVRLDELIDELIADAGIADHRDLVTRILKAGALLGADGPSRLDLKITAAAIEEMRAAFKLFSGFTKTPKVTVFGSARTQTHDPLWVAAESAARALAAQGWSVVTGAGPGIMEAAADGAGPEQSLGVAIRLPFEEAPVAPEGAEIGRRVTMKYFFTRKLMLVKESSGFICLPGGFGTMDETFELLTLQQTGKMDPVPIVLLDRPGGTFWSGLEGYVRTELVGSGMISPGDFDRAIVTDSVDAAVAEVAGFWRNYDSQRWFDDELVLRLRAEPSDAELAALNERFGSLCERGRIERAEPRPAEVREGDRVDLPRLVLVLRRRAVGELHRLIRALNDLPSAPEVLAAPSVR